MSVRVTLRVEESDDRVSTRGGGCRGERWRESPEGTDPGSHDSEGLRKVSKERDREG